jgi:hypothetical protein
MAAFQPINFAGIEPMGMKPFNQGMEAALAPFLNQRQAQESALQNALIQAQLEALPAEQQSKLRLQSAQAGKAEADAAKTMAQLQALGLLPDDMQGQMQAQQMQGGQAEGDGMPMYLQQAPEQMRSRQPRPIEMLMEQLRGGSQMPQMPGQSQMDMLSQQFEAPAQEDVSPLEKFYAENPNLERLPSQEELNRRKFLFGSSELTPDEKLTESLMKDYMKQFAPHSETIKTNQRKVISAEKAIPQLKRLLELEIPSQGFAAGAGRLIGGNIGFGAQEGVNQQAAYNGLLNSIKDDLLGAKGLSSTDHGLKTVEEMVGKKAGESDKAYDRRIKMFINDLMDIYEESGGKKDLGKRYDVSVKKGKIEENTVTGVLDGEEHEIPASKVDEFINDGGIING